MKSLFVVAAVAVGISGCGSQANTAETQSGISGADVRVLNTVNSYVNDWNRAVGRWSRTYKSGDRARILRTQERFAQHLHLASIRIRLSASQLDDGDLRRLMRQLGDAYRRQFHQIVAINDSVFNADVRAGQRALAGLHRAAEGKIRVAERLADRFPELGRDLTP